MNTNRARIFQRILVFAMILLLMTGLAGPAMADDRTPTYTEVSSWADLQTAIDGSSSAKTYLRLHKDVTASSTDSFLRIPNGKDIVLELNGKTLSRGLHENQNDGYVIKIEGGTFTLNDSSKNNSGKITGGKTKGTNVAGGVNVFDGGIFIMNGGTISGNTTGSGYGGGGVNVNNGTFNMSGGAIQNNNGFNGGGVNVTGGTFAMSNGKVEGNTASSLGGGVYLNGSGVQFTMEGGSISGNTTGLSGGGVYTTHGTINMSGGTISGNAAQEGGGVNIGSGGTFNMNGGAISDNNARNAGGGVYLYGTTGVLFTMNDGIISGNTSSQKGGGVYVDSASVFTIKSGTITGNTVNTRANNVYLNNSYGVLVNPTSDFNPSSKIGVTLASPPASTETKDFTSDDYPFTDETAKEIFTSDNPAYEVCANNGQAALKAVHFNLWVGDDQEVTGDHLSGTGWSFDPWTNTLTLEEYSYSGNGYSSEDTYQTSACIYYAGEKDFTLEIKGDNSLTNTNTDSTDQYYSHGIYCSQKLTIKDSTVNGKGTLTTTSAGTDGAMGIKGEQSIEIQGGTISATGMNYGISGERGVTISGGSVTANGSGNTGIGIHVGTGYSLAIGEHVESVDIIGNSYTASLSVKNAVKGFGWTNRQGTVGKTEIPISDTSQTLVNYVKIHFPVYHVTFKVSNGAWNDNTTGKKTVTPDLNENNKQVLSEYQIPNVGNKPDEDYKAGEWDITPTADTVITENTTYTYTYKAKDNQFTVPKARENLTCNGKAQELVIKSETDGEIQYALGTDETTVPGESAFTKTIPTATDAGTYYVWYKIVGDSNHADSEPVCVVVKIAPKPAQTAPAAPVVTATTADSITVKTVRGVEFSIDGVHWQTSGVFTGLNPDTTYVVQARKPETESHSASPASKTVVNTPAAQSQSGGTWRLGLRIFNVFNIFNSARQIVTTWNPWSVRTIWTPWWVRR